MIYETFKIGEPNDIDSSSEASEMVQLWISGYVRHNELPEGTYKVDQVNITKESDGWYATVLGQPYLVS